MVFEVGRAMFLTTPTIEELKDTDLPSLIEMLVKHTNDYHQELQIEGASSKSFAIKELIRNIQLAIESKTAIHNNTNHL